MMFGLWVYYTDDGRWMVGCLDIERHTECGGFVIRIIYIVDQEDPGRFSKFYDSGTTPKDAYVGC